MSKGLEAFNRIKSYFHPKQLLTRELTLNDLDTIEKELKALEIIKNKNVNVFGLHLSQPYWNVNDYNELVKLQHDRYLTQEEYDLLKEVLV